MNSEMQLVCKVNGCGGSFKRPSIFTKHLLDAHSITPEDYYIKYILNNEIPCCPFCSNKRAFISVNKGFKETCCSRACRNKQTGLKLRTRTETQKLESFLKRKQTNLKRYGDENYCNSSLISKKLKERSVEAKKITKEKAIKTCRKKYNVDWFSQTTDWENKVKKTNLETFGKEWFTQTEQSKSKMSLCKNDRIEAMKATNTQKYGVDSYSKTQAFVEKMKKTNRFRYGVDFTAQSCELAKNKKRKFEYKNETYDSNLEIEFVKKLEQLNIQYTYHPCCFTYFDSRKIEHRYFPDFEIEGKLYEVKGDYLLKNGKLYFPYRNGLTEDELRIIDDIYESKFKCMQEHNVVIISKKDLQETVLFSIFDKKN